MTENALHGILAGSLYPLRLGKTAHDTLQEFIDIDVTADDLVRILDNNPAYKRIFANFVMQKTVRVSKKVKSDDEKKNSPTHRLIALLGMIGSRNFILALRMHKAVTGNFPNVEDKKNTFSAPALIRRALEIEETFTRNKFAYPETVFAAAVAYDWLRFLAEQRPDFKKELEPYFQDTWKRMKRYAVFAHCLASLSPSFGFHKYAAAAAMLTQLGKLHLALGTSERRISWIFFEGSLSGVPIPKVALIAKEKELYGFCHEELSALSVNFFSVFKTLEPTIRYYREPYYLKGIDATQYRFAAFLELVDTFAGQWTLPTDDKSASALLRAAKRPWQNELPLAPPQWIEALRAAMNLR